MPKRALFASSAHWYSPSQIGDHHLARRFVADGWNVAFVSSPISPLHFASRWSRDLRARAAIYRAGGVRDLGGQLWAYVPGALIVPKRSPLLSSAWLHRNWHRLTVPGLGSLLRREGFDEVQLIHIRDPRMLFFLDLVPHKSSVFRLADYDPGFPDGAVAWRHLMAEAAARVDLLAYTARSLEPVVEELAPKARLFLPNGIDFSRFADAGTLPVPPELRGLPRPIAVYVGSLEYWFDFAVLAEVARLRPAVSFVVIGPESAGSRAFPPRENVHFLGSRPYTQIAAYLGHADVGMIPFDVRNHEALVSRVNPLKLYEYLAVGLPVVATDWDELRRIDSPAILCSGPAEFVAGIDRALSDPPDRQRLIEFARARDWRGMYDRLRAALSV
jgi:glycosyltransferase involved in cell wall biosynthesis